MQIEHTSKNTCSFSIDAATPNLTITIASPTTSTGSIIAQAGADLEVTCSVSVVDHLVSSPSVEWRGDNIDSSNVKVEMIDNLTVMLTFTPLHTSHGAVYSCVASIIIEAISVNKTAEQNENVIVQSK